MPDNKAPEDIDVTKEWRATHGLPSAFVFSRRYVAIAIGTEVAGVVLLRRAV